MATLFSNALGIDVGEKRVGFARVNSRARIPEPLGTFASSAVPQKIIDFLQTEDIDVVVVGLPRNMSGEETQQSKLVRSYAEEVIRPLIGQARLMFSDETLTTVDAAQRWSRSTIERYGIDSLAATLILENFLTMDIQ